MNDLRAAAEMALRALETKGEHHERVYAAIEALRQALAQDEQDCESTTIETISNAIDYLYSTGGEAKNIANQAHTALKQLQVNLRDQTVLHLLYKGDYEDLLAQPVYTAPESKSWVSLTEEEIMTMMNYGQHGRIPEYIKNFADAIEAVLRSKNESNT